jgi:hypothetical protein
MFAKRLLHDDPPDYKIKLLLEGACQIITLLSLDYIADILSTVLYIVYLHRNVGAMRVDVPCFKARPSLGPAW